MPRTIHARAVLGAALAISLIPGLLLAAALLHSGPQSSLLAHDMSQLMVPIESAATGAAGFWLLRALLHIGIAAVVTALLFRWGLVRRRSRTQLWLTVILATAIHYGVHVAQGVPLLEVLREPRSWDIPLFLMLGCFAVWHWQALRHGGHLFGSPFRRA